MTQQGMKVPVLNNMALCVQKLGQLDRSNMLLEKVIDIDMFNDKANARKLSNLFEMKNFDLLTREIKKIQGQPGKYNHLVRSTAS